MNIAIVGAGLMGRLLALSLLRENAECRRKVSITLFDKDNKLAHNSAAYAAAGLLTPLGESLHCEPNIVSMGFESLAFMASTCSTVWMNILFFSKLAPSW